MQRWQTSYLLMEIQFCLIFLFLFVCLRNYKDKFIFMSSLSIFLHQNSVSCFNSLLEFSHWPYKNTLDTYLNSRRWQILQREKKEKGSNTVKKRGNRTKAAVQISEQSIICKVAESNLCYTTLGFTNKQKKSYKKIRYTLLTQEKKNYLQRHQRWRVMLTRILLGPKV